MDNIVNTNLDLTILENLDFNLDCTGRNHSKWGSGDVVALCFLKNPCCGLEFERYLCAGCLNTTKSIGGVGVHNDSIAGCGKSWSPYKSCLVRVEYI